MTPMKLMEHRRKFIQSALRCAGLALLGGGAAALARRGGCAGDSPCRSCPRFDGCRLDKAVESRKPHTRNPHAG